MGEGVNVTGVAEGASLGNAVGAAVMKISQQKYSGIQLIIEVILNFTYILIVTKLT